MLVAHRWGGRRWIGIVALVFTFSLALSMWTMRSDPYAAFYLAPYRVWAAGGAACFCGSSLDQVPVAARWRRRAWAGLKSLMRCFAIRRQQPSRALQLWCPALAPAPYGTRCEAVPHVIGTEQRGASACRPNKVLYTPSESKYLRTGNTEGYRN